ncbi:MAG: Hsp20/alpha crystallin family protein [Deltaproteobacteria bacterium]|nr:Hsp20/alpha crystallin family protein [Deltaproteobacteria bacterium]
MALIRWLGEDDLISRMNRMQREMEDRFRNLWRYPSSATNVYPPMNVYDDGESFIVRAELPGVDPASLDISVAGDTLTVKGKRELESGDDKSSYHRRERSRGEFRRAFTMPDHVDNANVVASAKHGVLEIRLPRAEQAKQRKIEVKS